MNRLDVVAREVLGIERQNPADTMDVHRRHQLCVVDLTSQNAVLDHQALPFPINRG